MPDNIDVGDRDNLINIMKLLSRKNVLEILLDIERNQGQYSRDDLNKKYVHPTRSHRYKVSIQKLNLDLSHLKRYGYINTKIRESGDRRFRYFYTTAKWEKCRKLLQKYNQIV